MEGQAGGGWAATSCPATTCLTAQISSSSSSAGAQVSRGGEGSVRVGGGGGGGGGGDFPHHLLSSPPTNPQSQSAVQVTGGHMVGASPACYARKIIGPMPLRADSCIFPCRPMSNVHHHMLGQNKYLAMNVLQSIHRLKDVPSICHRQLKCERHRL